MSDFIHLRVHTAYSLAEGAIGVDDLAELCKKKKFPAVGVTDSHNLFGALEISSALAGAGVQPIIGVTLHVVDDHVLCANPPAGRVGRSDARIFAFPVFVKDEAGYTNLLKILADSYFDSASKDAPATSVSRVLERASGLMALSGASSGLVGALLQDGREAEAEHAMRLLQEAFGDRFYAELQRTGPEEAALAEKKAKLAIRLGVPFVATNEVFFADPGVHEAHDALLCIAEGTFLTEERRRRVPRECYFKSAREMKELFADLPVALANTVHFAKRCSFLVKKRAPILPSFPGAKDGDEAAELRLQAEEGLEVRLSAPNFRPELTEDERDAVKPAYRERLRYELDVIIKMKFPGYFLIVSDFIKTGKSMGIPIGPGRGSGAGSMAAWALQITDLDPIRFGLLFERFLNPERVSMPDFDVDFCQERREEVIRYVQRKYGSRNVAQIITFGKLQAKAVVRDVARVMQLPYMVADRLSKMIPFNPANPITLAQALEMDKNLRDMRKEDDDIDRLMSVALKLEGLYRHASTHAAGVVIGDRPLEELVPVYRDPRSDMPVCGFSMKYAEAAGMVKFDFLGLKTLTVIQKAVELIASAGKTPPDIALISLQDPPSYKLFADGDSVGVFQLESAGMRDVLRKMKPDNIDDIIALISLYRPGPMDNIPSYIARKHGKEEPDYFDPMLTDILRETYGVIIYQEQVMQVAQVMGGYSLGGADLLRRAMGKKIPAEMEQQRKIFVDGAVKNNVNKEKASSIFDILAKFAGYGFNKSHAAAYALISYQTAFLKANYCAEFLAASMNLDLDNTDKIAVFAQEAKLHNIPLLPPCVNKSLSLFSMEYTEDGTLAIRYGLGGLKNVGEKATDKIVEERNAKGPFKDLCDFFARAPQECLNKRMVENLVKAGALDALGPNRATIYGGIEVLCRYAAQAREEKQSGQRSLFGGGGEVTAPPPALENVKAWTSRENAERENEAMGFYLYNHPLGGFLKALAAKGVVMSFDFDSVDNGAKILVAGAVTEKRVKSSKRGRYASLTLSDPTGIFEVALFNETMLDAKRDILDPGKLLLINAHVRKDEGGMRLTIDDLQEITQSLFEGPRSVTLEAESVDALLALAPKIKNGTGKDTLRARVPMEGKTVTFLLGTRFRLEGDPWAELEGLKETG